MKILILCASGNSDGYTYHMCQQFQSAVSSDGHDAELVELSDMCIEDCNGCCSCKSGKGCVIKDDMSAMYSVLGFVDMVVMATPIRFSGPSSILKRFIDRLNPFWFSKADHPKFACAMMCGGSPEPKFTNARSEMVSAANTVGMKWLGELCIGGTDEPINQDERISLFAKEMVDLTRA
ncbi:MAG: flavodoxin family protein [archaeon]|nr:flavodoxin family protein [archaeon]